MGTTNRDRATWARTALDTYTRLTYGGRAIHELHEEDVATAIADLMCDLGHFARLYVEENVPGGRSMLSAVFEHDALFASARRHYEEERRTAWDVDDEGREEVTA